MAKISTYDKDVSLSGKDKVFGSNYVSTINSVDQYETANFTLKDLAEFVEGQINTSPVQLSLKTQGGIAIETINNTDVLAVNLSHTNITGQLANSDLVNSSITINGTSVALGGSITVATGDITGIVAGTYINGGGIQGSITINHDNTTRSNSTSSVNPNYGASFTVIDSIVSNATGHITDVNTKTVTLPVSDNTDTTYDLDLTQNSSDVDLKLDASTGTDTTIKFKAGSNVTLTKGIVGGVEQIAIASQAFGTVFTVNSESAMISATTTGGDIVIRTDVSKTFIHNGGSAGTVADFSELQFSGINTIALTAGAGIDISRTTLTNTNNDLTITNSLATALERGGIKIGYTENGKNYPVELASEKAYVNVPWVNTQYTAGGGIDLSGTEFSHSDTSSQASVDNSGRTYIQDITLDTYGHVTGLTSATETVTDTNDFVDGISVSGTTTKTITLSRTGALADLTANFTDNDTQYSQATSSQLGLVKIGYTENAKNYPVELSNGQMFVNVPWTDTDTQYTAGTGLTLNGTRFDANVDGTNSVTPNASSSTASRTYKVQVDALDNLVVNVPWVDTDTDTTRWKFKVDTGTDEVINEDDRVTFTSGTNVTLSQTGKTIDIAATNTTYTAGTGLTLNGTTFNANVDGTQTTAANTSTTTANRTYKVQVDSSDNLVVNVPWVDTDTDNNTTYDLLVPENTTKIRLTGSDGTNDDVEIAGGTNVTITRNNANKLTVASTNTQRAAGIGLSLSGNTINANVVNNATTQTPQSITTTANRLYQIETDDQDNLVVNVPWIDTTDPDNNNYVTGASVSGTTTKTLTLTRQGLGDVTANWTDINTQRSDEDIRDVTVTMLTEGSNITLTEDDAANTLTIAAANTNTTYTTEIPASTTKLRLVGSDGTNEDIEFVGTGATTVTRTNENKFTISSTDTIDMGDGFTVEADTNSNATTIIEGETLTIAGGTNVTTETTADGTVTINATDSNTFRPVTAGGNTLGATETLAFTEGSNVTITENAGAVTITAANTTYSAGTGLTLTGTQFSVNTTQVINQITPTFTGSNTYLQINGQSGYYDGAIKLMCSAGSHGQILKSQPHSAGVTNTILMPAGGNSTLVSEATLGPLTTLQAVTGRGASTTVASTFSGGLSNTGGYFSARGNIFGSNPTAQHGLSIGWNKQGSRETAMYFSPGSDATTAHFQQSYLHIIARQNSTSGANSGTVNDVTIAKMFGTGQVIFTGPLQFSNYGDGSNVGTQTHLLGVDANGNIKTSAVSGSPIDGGGTVNKIPKYSDTDTLTDSIMTEDASNYKVSLAGVTSSGVLVTPSRMDADVYINERVIETFAFNYVKTTVGGVVQYVHIPLGYSDVDSMSGSKEHYFVAPRHGRVRAMILRPISNASALTTVQFKIQKIDQNSNISTIYEQNTSTTLFGSNKYVQAAGLEPGNGVTFNLGDFLLFQMRSSASLGNLVGSIVLEFTQDV